MNFRFQLFNDDSKFAKTFNPGQELTRDFRGSEVEILYSPLLSTLKKAQLHVECLAHFLRLRSFSTIILIWGNTLYG